LPFPTADSGVFLPVVVLDAAITAINPLILRVITGVSSNERLVVGLAVLAGAWPYLMLA
jgi:hypothetical protein